MRLKDREWKGEKEAEDEEEEKEKVAWRTCRVLNHSVKINVLLIFLLLIRFIIYFSGWRRLCGCGCEGRRVGVGIERGMWMWV